MHVLKCKGTKYETTKKNKKKKHTHNNKNKTKQNVLAIEYISISFRFFLEIYQCSHFLVDFVDEFTNS